MLKKGRLLNMMFDAEKFILKHNNIVSIISKGMLKRVKQKNIKGLETILFPNWVDEKSIIPLQKEHSLRNEFGLSQNDKGILYSGNLGKKQGLEIIVDVAKEFAGRTDIIFLIVGSGDNKEILRQSVEENNLKNVCFYPLVSKNKLSALLATAYIHLVLQKKSASDLMMPSKLSGILAAGGCAIVTAQRGTSLYEMIEQNHLGLEVAPDSPYALKTCTEKVLSSNLDFYRKNARQDAIAYLSKEWIMRILKERYIMP